jgi:hypothetical protein
MAMSWLGKPVYDVGDVDGEAIKNLSDHEKCSHQGHCNKRKFQRLLVPLTPASESKRHSNGNFREKCGLAEAAN